MTEPTNTLILEHLKAIQERLARIESDIREVRQEQRIERGLAGSMVLSDSVRQGEIARMLVRMDRIEARLNLSD